MKRCKYVEERKGVLCTAWATVSPDKTQPSKVHRYKDPNGKDDWTVQAYYPTESDDYCYFHEKIIRGLVQKQTVK